MHEKDTDAEIADDSDEEVPELPAPAKLPSADALSGVRDLENFFSQLETSTDEQFLYLSSFEDFLLKQVAHFQHHKVSSTSLGTYGASFLHLILLCSILYECTVKPHIVVS